MIILEDGKKLTTDWKLKTWILQKADTYNIYENQNYSTFFHGCPIHLTYYTEQTLTNFNSQTHSTLSISFINTRAWVF